MRLLMVTTVPGTLRAFLLPHAAHLRARGWAVDAATNTGAMPPAVTDAFDRVHGVPWDRSLSRTRALAAVRAMRGILVGYDLVHVHTPIASALTRAAAATLPARRRPVLVYTAHGFHFHDGGRPLSNAAYASVERVAGRWTDHLIVLTEQDRRAALDRHLVPAGRLTVVPGVGIDLDHYAPTPHLLARAASVRDDLGLPADGVILTAVANLDPGKNHAATVRALALLPATTHLVCAGSGPEEARLRALAAELGVAARLHLIGVVADVRPLVLASDAMVLPSRREGLCRAVMEALALGVPVVGARVRGIAELVPPEGGELVDPDDVDGLVDALRRVARFPPPAQLRARLEPHLARYALDGVLAVQDALYDRLLQQRQPVGG